MFVTERYNTTIMRNRSICFKLILFALTCLLFYSGCEKEPVQGITDIDGNVYDTVRIGNQLWMKENLRTTRLNDGTELALTPYSVEWSILQKPGYCWYGNHEAFFSLNRYGALYNWYAVKTKKLCPVGWHVPTDADWRELSDYIGWDTGGGKLREAGTDNWAEPNTAATNETGFSALPGGKRNAYYKDYQRFRYTAYFWCSDNGSTFSLSNTDSNVSSRPGLSESDGASVRCLKDK